MKHGVVQIVKVIVIDIIITMIATLILSLLLYKFKFGDSILRACIVGVYAISNFVGGYIIGKIKETKKYIWGAITGFTYFLLLTLISIIVSGELYGNGNMAIMALLSSVIGGSIGGMLS